MGLLSDVKKKLTPRKLTKQELCNHDFEFHSAGVPEGWFKSGMILISFKCKKCGGFTKTVHDLTDPNRNTGIEKILEKKGLISTVKKDGKTYSVIQKNGEAKAFLQK